MCFCVFILSSGGNRVVRFPKGKERLDSLVLLIVLCVSVN